MRPLHCLFAAALLALCSPLVAQDEATALPPIPIVGTSEVLASFDAPEARQGVAVDAEFVYVIGNTEIGKYRKDTFERVAQWSCEEGDPLIHLNAGIVLDGLLYTAHSNYPEIPMLGSVEIYDPTDLQPLDTHSFGYGLGSTTWLDRRGGDWFVCFAHYDNRAAEPVRDPRWTLLVRFDADWTRREAWGFPTRLLPEFGRYSSSGGAFGPGGYLYITGHDHPRLYLLTLPEQGGRLVLHGKIEVATPGQAFAWDPTDPTVMWGIVKSERRVVAQRITLSTEALAKE